MDPALLKLHWPVLEAKLRQRFPLLGNEPLPWKDGEEEELIHGIAKRAGRPRTFIDGFLESAVAEILRGGNVPATMMENNERLGNPRGSRDLPPAPERSGMTRLPDGPRRHGT